MENVTIGQILGVLGTITTICAFVFAVNKLYKTNITDRFRIIEKDVENMKKDIVEVQEDMDNTKKERRILLQGQLACLKALNNNSDNEEIVSAISNIENYLLNK